MVVSIKTQRKPALRLHRKVFKALAHRIEVNDIQGADGWQFPKTAYRPPFAFYLQVGAEIGC